MPSHLRERVVRHPSAVTRGGELPVMESRLPDGEMCLQEMEGSGFPVARHTRVTLLPSFTTMSLEMRNIFGETGRKEGETGKGELLNPCNPGRAGRAEESRDTSTAVTGKNTRAC